MLLCAARELAAAGELPVNVRFCCDGEEETGGHSIVEFLEADERGADAAVIFDSGMIARDVPAFNVATRGMSYFHVTLRTGDARPAFRHVRRGRAERRARADRSAGRAGRARRAPASSRCARASSRRPRRSSPAGASCRRAPTSSRDQGARPDDRGGRGVLPAHLRRARDRRERDRERLAAPAEDRAAGRGGRERLDPARAGPAGRRDRARGRAAPARGGRRREPSSRSSCWSRPRRASCRPTRKAIQLGLDAFERVLGRRPALIRTGGTLPIVPALSDKGIPAVDHRLRPAGLADPFAERAAGRRLRALGIAAGS